MPSAGELFDHYRILEPIGKGGMGEVFLARDTVLDRKVAVKFLSDSAEGERESRKRILREAKAAAALDHPFICHVYETGEAQGKAFIAMEYVAGETLSARLARGPLPLDQAIRTMSELTEALEDAHGKGIVHRDLKPSNIMLTPQGHVKIMDFGLAKQAFGATDPQTQETTDSFETLAGTLAGTIGYMSPEQARAIGRTINARLTPQEEARLVTTRPVNEESYRAYLRGSSFLNRSAQLDLEKGLAYLQEAVDKDPGDPLALAGLAYGYVTLGHGPAAPPDAWQRAREAAQRALKLDPNLAEGYANIADVKLYYERDYKGAEANFRRAMELNPSLAMNHYHYAWYLALFGRMDEAIKEHKRAQELDPLTPLHTAWLGELYRMKDQPDMAIEEAAKCLKLYPRSALSWMITGMAYADKGMFSEAIAALQKAVAVTPFWRTELGQVYARAGRRDEAMKILAELEGEKPTPYGAWSLAGLAAELGDKDKAFQWIAYEPSHAWMAWFRVSPKFRSLRADPRFNQLLRKYNLPDLD